MKNTAKKNIAIGLGVCLLALLFVLLLFINRPYTKKVIIWLPDNYKLENTVSNEVVSIMPNSDASHQPNEVFYLQIGMDSFKNLFGRNGEAVRVKIEDASHPSHFAEGEYRTVYQKEFNCEDKSFFVVAQEYYDYNRFTLSEMIIKDGELLLKNKRNTCLISSLLSLGFFAIAFVVFIYWLVLDIKSKQINN